MDKRTIEAITSFIFMEDKPQASDIILIPGSARAEICETAAALYRAGYAPWVLPSGRFSCSVGRFASEFADPRYGCDFETEFDYCRHILLQNGVPDAAILKEDRATNTAENACFSAEVVKRRGIEVRRALICPQAYHARRAYMTYTTYFLPDVEYRVIPSVTQGVGRDTWYQEEENWRLVLGEVEKCGRYFADCLGMVGDRSAIDANYMTYLV